MKKVKKFCHDCGNYKCRCADCWALTEINNRWWCGDYDNYCEEVKDCCNYEDETGCEVVIYADEFEKHKISDELIANAIADIGALYDLDLTKEEMNECMTMMIKLQKIGSRIDKDFRFEFESIM